MFGPSGTPANITAALPKHSSTQPSDRGRRWIGPRRLRRGFPAATNDSAHGDFGPYYPRGTGCRMETVMVRSRKIRINAVGECGP
jgi:hypothetical protein